MNMRILPTPLNLKNFHYLTIYRDILMAENNHKTYWSPDEINQYLMECNDFNYNSFKFKYLEKNDWKFRLKINFDKVEILRIMKSIIE